MPTFDKKSQIMTKISIFSKRTWWNFFPFWYILFNVREGTIPLGPVNFHHFWQMDGLLELLGPLCLIIKGHGRITRQAPNELRSSPMSLFYLPVLNEIQKKGSAVSLELSVSHWGSRALVSSATRISWKRRQKFYKYPNFKANLDLCPFLSDTG